MDTHACRQRDSDVAAADRRSWVTIYWRLPSYICNKNEGNDLKIINKFKMKTQNNNNYNINNKTKNAQLWQDH